jgi:hypothetical protein
VVRRYTISAQALHHELCWEGNSGLGLRLPWADWFFLMTGVLCEPVKWVARSQKKTNQPSPNAPNPTQPKLVSVHGRSGNINMAYGDL